MEALAYLFGIGLTMLLFFLLLVVFQEKNFLLKYLFIMGIFFAGYMIPTVVMDVRTTCETVINTSTVTGNTTSFSYMQQCFTTTTKTADTFFIVYSWIFFAMIGYFIVKVFYDLYQYYFKGKKFNMNQGGPR